MTKVVRGSGLCSGVRFEVEPSFIRASHCHCNRCRKDSGTIRMGAFDDDPGIGPQFHTYVDSRAVGHDYGHLPQHARLGTREERLTKAGIATLS